MSEDKTAGLLFALGLNDPEHHTRAKDIVAKVAQNRFTVYQISTEKGLHPSKISVDKGLTLSKLATDKGFKVSKITTDKGLTANKISTDKGMTLATLTDANEQGLWVEHIEKIAKKHRGVYGAKNEHIPALIPMEIKHIAAKMFRKYHENEIKELVVAIKKAKASKGHLGMVKAAKSKGNILGKK